MKLSLSKQLALNADAKAMQQINFTVNLTYNVTKIKQYV